MRFDRMEINMRKYLSAIAMMLCLAMLLPFALVSCGGGEPSDTTPDVTTPEETPEETPTETPEETPGETTPGGEDPSKPQEGEKKVLEVKWNQGQVMSNFNGGTPGIGGSSGYVYTDIITVPKAGTKISFKDPHPDFAGRGIYVISSWKEYMKNIWIPDKEGINISGSGASGSPIAYPKGVPTRTSITYEYITSKDNETIRLCCQTDTNPVVYITENAGVGTYQEYLDFIEDSKESVYNKSFEGITMALFGDSYLAGNRIRGEYTWAAFLADKYGMELYNHSIGGSTVSDKVTSNTPLVDRWNKYSGDPQIIIVECGRNDSNASLGIKMGTPQDTTTHTFLGALLFMLRNLREKYPNAMIVGITSYNSVDRQSTLDYAAAMRDLFAQYGYPCIYAADPKVSGVDTSKASFRDQYMELPEDYSHLNYRGHMMALPYFEAALAKCYEDFLAGKYVEKEIHYIDDNPPPENSAWNYGFVGSDKMSGGQDFTLVKGVREYYYSNVITIEKAGTTIYFKDLYGKKENITPNTVFIFSSWKKEGNDWVLDREGTNIRADQAVKRQEGSGYVVWSYTTTKDNENIRLCLRVEDDPADVAIMYENVGAPKQPNWNSGYIHTGTLGQPQGSHGGSAVHAYTDVFTVEKAGTTVYFEDLGDVSTNGAYYIFSSWKKDAQGNWVFDAEGTNLASDVAFIKTTVNGKTVWSYTTTKDNENLRVGLRCEKDPVLPQICFDLPEEEENQG